MGYVGDQKRKYQLDWINARKKEWFDSRGGACERCGSKERLEADHIDRALKTMEPRSIWSRRAEVRHAELKLCQVLCHLCHKEKTREELFIFAEHGTLRRYKKHGCKCKLCKDANATYRRWMRASKKFSKD